MKRYFNLRIPVILSSAFCLGILISYLSVIYGMYVILIALAAAALSAALIFLVIIPLCFKNKNEGSVFKSSSKLLFIFLLVLVPLICGFIYFNFRFSYFDDEDFASGKYNIYGKVESADAAGGEVYRYILSDIQFTDEYGSVYKAKGDLEVNIYNGNILIDNGCYIRLEAQVNAVGILKNNEINNRYLINNIKYRCGANAGGIEILDYKPTVFQYIQNKALYTLSDNMKPDGFGLSFSLLTGNKNYLDGNILTSFRNGGVAHVLAVSGLHVGFLYGILLFIFKKLKVKPKYSTPVIILILFLYSGVCGFSPSSLRAVIMCAVFLSAKTLGKKNDSLNSLFLSALIVLLISPFYLTDAGFLLSYSCMLAIILLNPQLKKLFSFMPKVIRDSLSMILAAQIGAGAVSLAIFNSYSVAGFFLNFFVVPVISVIYTLLFSITFFAVIFPPIGFLLKIPEMFTSALIWLITLSDYKAFLITGFTFGIFTVLYYAAAVGLSSLINVKKVTRLSLGAALIAALILGNVITGAYEKVYQRVIVYSENGTLFSAVKTSGGNYIIVNGASVKFNEDKLIGLMQSYNMRNLSGVFFINDKIDCLVFSDKIYRQFGKFDVYIPEFYSGSEDLINILSDNYDIEIMIFDREFTINGDSFVFYGDADNFTGLRLISGEFDMFFASNIKEDSEFYLDNINVNKFNIIIGQSLENALYENFSPDIMFTYSEFENPDKKIYSAHNRDLVKLKIKKGRITEG